VFVAHLESLISSVDEVVILPDTTGGNADLSLLNTTILLNELGPIAEKYGASHVWYVMPECSDFEAVMDQELKNCTVSITEANELFRRLMPLPNTFADTVVSEVDMSSYSYQTAFQKRSATSPLRPTEGTEKEELSSLDDELKRWAESVESERPLFLLGDRGSGKTWQLLKFCDQQYERSLRSPWTSPPALYLGLRRTLEYLNDPQQSSLGLFGLLSDLGRGFNVKWNIAMFQALLECNQLIVCLDGLDEVEIQPTDVSVRDHLRRIVAMLPMRSRFIISSRATHFSSLDELYSLETWPGTDVNNTFRILQLSSLGDRNLIEYAELLENSDPSNAGVRSLKSMLFGNGSSDVLANALRRCCQQPALLAKVVFDTQSKHECSLYGLLQAAIESTFVEYNVQFERTRPLHLDAEGGRRTFDAPTRMAFLGELAWWMSERRLEQLDLDRLPARLTKMFGIDTEPLERDIRSQTVFELADVSHRIASDSYRDIFHDVERLPSIVRFGLRYQEEANTGDSKGDSSGTVGCASAQVSSDGVNDSELPLSVSESYFLASHIANRLADSDHLDGLKFEDTLHFLGCVPLNGLAAAILREKLISTSGEKAWSKRILRQSVNLIRRLARQGNCQVFAHPHRYLFQNLESLGYVSRKVRTLLEPWIPELCPILSCPNSLGRYELLLVPSPSSSKLKGKAIAAGGFVSTSPFLLGIHEITNDQFREFILSPQGVDWSVERITRAASESGSPQSKFASLTTEYHLYFWEESEESPSSFRPPLELKRHPVVYVSWHLAQAYCNWLSEEAGRPLVCRVPEKPRTTKLVSDMTSSGFRLPTAMEWWWAAQGPDDKAEFPWDLLPYPIKIGNDESTSVCPEAARFEWFQQYRNAAREVVLDSGRRSAEVAYDDDIGPFGAIGLIGNVKEWVQDIVREHKSDVEKAIVCGTTAHLGLNSFSIGYYATLFPENSNPDLGFRVARSLAPGELDALRHRETALASISDAEIDDFSA
jgi:formylglycine-generating enzyme required for sulfatase activity